MASGKRHEKFSILGLTMLLAATLVLFYSYGWSRDVFWMIIGGFLAFFIDPDMMDQHNITTRGEHRLYKIPLIGWILGYVVEIITFPLARIIPHRSMWSHFPIISSALRIAYLGLWIYIIDITIYPQHWPRIELEYWQIVYIYAGSMWIDIIHTTLDNWKIRW